MGDSQSKPEPASIQSAAKLTDTRWRKFIKDNKSLREEIMSIKPKCPANVLLLGPTGAGKSSFINSILSTAHERRVNKAYTGDKRTSFTTTFEKFMDVGIMQYCCLYDSMGIEQVVDGGLLLDDIDYLLKGHIQSGYRFNPRSKISENDPHFRLKPDIEHEIHCVVFVINSCTVLETSLKQFMTKINALQDHVHSHNIPCILILTKIDEFCQKVHEDVGNTFRSVKVRDVVKDAAERFGIPAGNIHPIRNFEVDTEIDDAASNLVLIALKQIMYYAYDKIEELKAKKN